MFDMLSQTSALGRSVCEVEVQNLHRRMEKGEDNPVDL